MESAAPQHASELHTFLNYLFEGFHEGYAYAAFVDPTDKTKWAQEFFDLSQSDSLGQLENRIQENSGKLEVYVSPSIFKEKRADKEAFLATQFFWTDFDGNAPKEWEENSAPSMRVASSSDAHQHVYWKLNEPITDAQELERINRGITYSLSADYSAWHAVKVLRPPGTVNLKPDREKQTVRLIELNNVTYEPSVFSAVADKFEYQEATPWKLATLPDPLDVILKYAFSPDLRLLLAKDYKTEPFDRSKALMQLAYGCCELGMTDVEVFVTLRMADDNWEKFKFRKDREQRLSDIISRARIKHPAREIDEPAEDQLMVFGFESFLATEISIEWVIEGMLMEGGSMLFVGPSGHGKTQFSMQALIHLALGKDFLHYKVQKPKKVLFLSLEMGHGELKIFMQAMRKALSDEEAALLERNFLVVPMGEPIAMNKPEGQQLVLKLLDHFEPDGVFIDSIGSAIEGNISDDTNVQPYTKFIDIIRNRYNVFVWAIHHMRKKPNGDHGGYSQDDVYGNQYLFNRATSTYLLQLAKQGIRIRNLKMRLADNEEDYFVQRDADTLTFTKLVVDVDKKLADLTYKQPEPPTISPGGIPL